MNLEEGRLIMKIVMVVGGYYPYFSATGNCMGKIASVLQKSHEVSIISEKKKSSEVLSDDWKGQKILRVETKRSKRRLLLVEKGKNISLFVHKAYWFLRFLLKPSGLDTSLIDAYFIKLSNLYAEEQFDIVMPCCMPIEGVYASYLFCKQYQNVKLYPVLFDLYSDSDNFFRKNFIKKFKARRALEIEKKMFSLAEHIFYVDNWKTYFISNLYNSTLIEHPLISYEKKVPLRLKGNSKIKLIYQGEVNYEIRNPLDAIRSISSIFSMDHKKVLSFHVFSFGNAYKEFEKIDKDSYDVCLYGKVSKEDADRYAESADISVIIANKNPNIIPSKVYECISIGKPIIYFTSNNEDKPSQILKSYKYAYIFNTKTSDLDELYGWINNNYDKRISYQDLPDIYKVSTPEYISWQISEVLKKRHTNE